MNDYNELKLAVYESTLDSDEKEAMIEMMESCDDDDLQDICEAVDTTIRGVNKHTADFDNVDDFIDDLRETLEKDFYTINEQIKKFKKHASNAKEAGKVAAAGAVSTGAFLAAMKAVKSELKKFEGIADKLEGNDKKKLESVISKYKKQYTKCRIAAIASGAVTAGAVAVVTTNLVKTVNDKKFSKKIDVYHDNIKNNRKSEFDRDEEDTGLVNYSIWAKSRVDENRKLPKAFEREYEKRLETARRRLDKANIE